VDEGVAEILLKEKIEFAFLALHGRLGEDGTIQGMLELMRIPYTGSGVLSSALAIHKIMAKKFFICEGIPTPRFAAIQRGEVKKDPSKTIPFPLPLVVKPAREGSTIGVSIVKEEKEWVPALEEAGRFDDEILVEEFVSGKEITVGILGDIPLPVIEIAPRAVFTITIPSIRREKPSMSFRRGSRGRSTSTLRKSALRPFECWVVPGVPAWI